MLRAGPRPVDPFDFHPLLALETNEPSKKDDFSKFSKLMNKLFCKNQEKCSFGLYKFKKMFNI